MNKLNRIFSGLLVLFVILCAAAPAVGAVDVEAGKTATVSFSFPNTFSVDGYFDYSNAGLFSGMSFRNNSSLVGEISNDKLYLYGSDPVNVSVELDVTVKATANVGDSCTITVHYETADLDGNMSEWKTMEQTVTVKAAEVVTEPVVTTPPETTAPPDTTPPETTPPETTPEWTEPRETEPEPPAIDYTELLRQIGIAEGLNEDEYTIDSFERMLEALEAARALRTSLSQEDVDAGAEALKRAVAELVKIDLKGLTDAVARANALEGDSTCAHSPLWFKLFAALGRVEETAASRDQKRIDALAEEINGIIDEIIEDCPNCGEQSEKIVEKIKEVEVEPSGPFCNIPIHKLWPILFFISLGINVIMIALLVWFLAKRKKNETDDTPLVDYDIGDDEK